jgi:hypothetical protein
MPPGAEEDEGDVEEEGEEGESGVDEVGKGVWVVVAICISWFYGWRDRPRRSRWNVSCQQ